MKHLGMGMGRPLGSAILQWLGTLSLAGLGGVAFQWAALPLPWLLGPMCATFMAALAGLKVRLPDSLRPPMVTVIGTLLGASVTMDMMARAPTMWLPLLGVLALVGVGACLSTVYFRLVARFDWRTAYFAGMPGGIVEMITLGTAYGADVKRIAIVHASRILLTVFLVPFLLTAAAGGVDLPSDRASQIELGAPESWLWLLFCCAFGYLGGRVLRLPTPELLGPLILSSALHLLGITAFATPAPMVAIAQLVIGSLIGCRFAGLRTRELVGLFAYSAGSVVLLMGVAMALAFAVASISGMHKDLLILAYAPGGLAEMSLIALSMQFEVSLVVVAHIARILLVALGAAPILTVMGARRSATQAATPHNPPGPSTPEQD